MSASLIPAGASLVEETARLIEEAGGDPADALVVFPGKRPAHFLRQRLARARGAGFAPPRVLSMDELVDDVFEMREGRQGVVRPKAEAIDAVALLYDIQLGAAAPVGGTAFMTLDSFFSLGVKIHGDLEELLIERVRPADVAGVQPLVEEEVPARARERLRTLALFYEEFYRAVDRHGLSTRSSRYVAVADELAPEDLPGAGPVIFAGFYTLTRAERALFQRIRDWPRVSLLFQDGPGIAARIKGLMPGAPGNAAWRPPSRPRLSFSGSPDTHGQVFALNAALGAVDDSTLVVLPTPDTLFPLLRHCLSRVDPEDYNVSLPFPLQRTPLFGFLNNLMELVGSMDGERVYLPAYVSFVLHPYVKNVRLGASAEATRVLFHALEERLAQSRTRRFATLEEIEGDEGLFAEAADRIAEEGSNEKAAELRTHLRDIHERTLGRFRSFRSVREFAERCIELISWVHDESTARDHPYFTPFSESFVQSLDEISRSLMAEKSFNDTQSYFTLLRSYLQARYLSFPGTPLHGLQVLGALETRNLRFDRVFVLDANEGVLPGTGVESTLLPFSVRRALGLSTYQDQEDITAYHFELLAAGAKEMHLFFIEAGDKERSRFVERLLWEQQRAQGLGDPKSLIRSINYQVTLTNRPPAPVEKTPEVAEWLRGFAHSASSLDAYLQCPLKFYYTHVLRLGPREEASGEIEAVDIGIFVHDVLSRHFSSRVQRPLTAEDADPAAISAVVDDLFPGRFGAAETGANRLLRNQIRRHLGDFLSGYLRPLVETHRVTIRGLEQSVRTTWKGFLLRGRMDVVQERDGRTVLIDYKSSAHRANYSIGLKKLDPVDRGSWGKAIPTLQLPFYVLLHARETGRDPIDIHAMFLMLGRAEMDERIELPLFPAPEDAAAGWPMLEAVISGLLEEIVSADVPFSAAENLRTACPRCDFTNICGTGWLKKGG